MRQKRSPRQSRPAPKLSSTISNTFHKHERLCSRKLMEELFASGRSFTAQPLKAVVMDSPVGLPCPAQAMFVVPKRSFRDAHDRNVLKRRMKEAYRLNKNQIYDTLRGEDRQVLIAILYIGKTESPYQLIETSLQKLIVRLQKPK